MHSNWEEVLEEPALGDHIVQVYQDKAFLSEAVSHYLGIGVKKNEAGIVIARREHWQAFAAALGRRGLDVDELMARGQLRVLDADATLATFMLDGMPDWTRFHRVIGGAIAELRLQHSSVRAYGEMVDVLWQDGQRRAAIALEEFWNEIGKLQTFSLFCAYEMSNLDADAYGGALQSVCKVHTHMIPARDYRRFNATVLEATSKVLGRPLAEVMASASGARAHGTQMPSGQAALLWMRRHMPLTAEKILAEVRARN